MSTLYKVCKRTIERAIADGTIDNIREDMQAKIDLYSAAGKITVEEYEELSAMLVKKTKRSTSK